MKKYFFSVGILLATVTFVYASQSSGTVDGTFHNARVCYDTSCVTGGNINFLPTTGVGINPVTIDDTNGLDGHAWGTDIGWINLGPQGSGVTFSDTSTGSTTGFAYSQVAGWINFAPTGYGVKINTNGEFQGYAWTSGQNGGWIKFDCGSGAGYCVKTDWRPTTARTSSPGGGGGGGGGGSIVNPNTNQINNTFQSQTGVQNQSVDYTNDFRADIDDSGIVDLLDLNRLMIDWGKSNVVSLSDSRQVRCKGVNRSDINCDGTVNLLDFNLIMVYWKTYVGDQGVQLKQKYGIK